MSARNKPFAYDAVETLTAVIFIVPLVGGSNEPATATLAPNGLQVDRRDGSLIRFGNLHPRLRDVVASKAVYVCEFDGRKAVVYPAGPALPLEGGLSQHLGKAFYWYVGPEVSTLKEVAERPFARLLSQVSPDPVAIAPGQAIGGPVIGLCASSKGFIPLARGRRWAQARRGLIVDAGLAAGTIAGYPANDDIPLSVSLAHQDTVNVPAEQPRRAWSSQIACAFPASVPEVLQQA